MALVALAVGTLTLNRLLVGVFYDDGLYAGLAVALAGGQGYVHPHLPGAPPAIHFPPLYPLVLAPLFGTLSVDAAALAGKILNVLLGAVAAGLVTWHAVRIDLLGPRAPRVLAPAVVVATTFAMPALTLQSVLFAEQLFAVLVAGAVALVDRPAGKAAGVAGFLAALALLTRSIGLAAGAGVVLHLRYGLQSSWRTASAAAAPVGVAALTWGIWVLMHRDEIDPALALNYGSYFEVVRQAGFAAFGSGAFDLPRPLAAITVGALRDLLGPLYYPVSAGALAITLYGLGLFVRRSAIGLTLLVYIAILVIWPYPPDRFLWAVLPWLGLAWTAGVLALWPRRLLQVPLILIALGVVGGYVAYQGSRYADRRWEHQARVISANFAELLPALDSLPSGSVLATDDEALVWLYTRQPAVPFYLYQYRGAQQVEPPAAEHRAYLERQGVTHVLLADPRFASGRALRALIDRYPGWLVGVRRWSRARWLFEVRPDR